MRMILILVLFVIFCCGCNKQPVEFFQIKVEESNDDAFLSRYEYFVVSNLPKDTLRIKKMVEEYNFQTISLDTLKKYNKYTREFYRETGCLTRNYKEGEPYPQLHGWQYWLCFPCIFEHYGYDPGQQIRYHSYDLVIETNYFSPTHSSYWDYRYQFGLNINGKFIEGKKVRINNIDSFWMENIKNINK